MNPLQEFEQAVIRASTHAVTVKSTVVARTKDGLKPHAKTLSGQQLELRPSDKTRAAIREAAAELVETELKTLQELLSANTANGGAGITTVSMRDVLRVRLGQYARWRKEGQ